MAYINGGGTTVLHPDFASDPPYGIPYVTVPGTQPKVPITFTGAPDQSDPGPYPIPPTAPVEAGSDAHVVVIDTTNCILYEVYQGQYLGGTTHAWQGYSGAVWSLKSNALRPAGWTSADAAGLPIFPGLARCVEAKNDAITHALRFTVRSTAPSWLYPARHIAGSVSTPYAPPMGLRLRLKAVFSIPATGVGPQSLGILHALKKYGMIVADNGSAVDI